MNFETLQFVVAKNDTNFSDIIFIVVIAVFWIIGVIAKVVSKQSKKSEKPAEKQRIIKQPSQGVQVQTKPKRPVRAARPEKLKKYYVEKTPKKQPVSEIGALISEKPELSISMPAIETGLESVIKKEKKQATQPSITESFLNFESVDDLKKGILYYEILGKPLSLRQQERLF
jgi:cytoskeletal protein RodZ